ncbi:MAG: aldo/keto reductase [Bdellovibrionaceae bacterium]|nr:aldo/keto reductase [Pseudobdellovibrionaceae bacterium]
MEYRRLGKSGLKISQLSFGSWVTFGNQMDIKPVVESMAVARDHGVNFFDNAEVYAGGKSEELMGAALKELKWARHSYLISTKFFWGIHDGPNTKNTLNRKYLLEGMNASLKRLQLDYVDLVYCHRADPQTPLEETVFAMHDLIQRGQALYWGTSEWTADEIRGAWSIADKYGLHKPIVEQPQYNLFHREKVEKEFARLYDEVGLGLTIWSPLASGILTGKYLNGIPEQSRGAMMGWVGEEAKKAEKIEKTKKFVAIAQELDVTPAALAIAWCSSNPRVSSVITGASRVSQVGDNMKALAALPKLTIEVRERLEQIFGENSK